MYNVIEPSITHYIHDSITSSNTKNRWFYLLEPHIPSWVLHGNLARGAFARCDVAGLGQRPHQNHEARIWRWVGSGTFLVCDHGETTIINYKYIQLLGGLG